MTKPNFTSKDRFYQKQIADLMGSISGATDEGWSDQIYEEVIGYLKATAVMYHATTSIPIFTVHELQGAADCLQLQRDELEAVVIDDGWNLTGNALNEAFSFASGSAS